MQAFFEKKFEKIPEQFSGNFPHNLREEPHIYPANPSTKFREAPRVLRIPAEQNSTTHLQLF